MLNPKRRSSPNCIWSREISNSWASKRDYAFEWIQYDEVWTDILYNYFCTDAFRKNIKTIILQHNKMNPLEGLKVSSIYFQY